MPLQRNAVPLQGEMTLTEFNRAGEVLARRCSSICNSSIWQKIQVHLVAPRGGRLRDRSQGHIKSINYPRQQCLRGSFSEGNRRHHELHGVDGLVRQHRISEALVNVESILHHHGMDMHVKADAVSRAVLFLETRGDGMRASRMINESFRRYGILPSYRTLRTAIRACRVPGMHGEIVNLLESWRKLSRGAPTPPDLCTVAADAFDMCGRADMAKHMRDLVGSGNIAAAAAAASPRKLAAEKLQSDLTALRELAEMGNPAQGGRGALCLYTEFADKYEGVIPTPDSLALTVRALCRCGWVDEALSVVMNYENITGGLRFPSAYPFVFIMEGYCRAHRGVEVRAVFAQMLRRRLQPSVAHANILMLSAARDGEFARAREVWEDLLRGGGGSFGSQPPTEYSFYAILLGAARARQAEFSLEVLDILRATPGMPNPKCEFYELAMLACARVAWYDEAVRLLDQMKRAGLHPRLQTYEVLMEAATSVGDFDSAHAWMKECSKSLGVRVSQRAMKRLSVALSRADMEAAVQ